MNLSPVIISIPVFFILIAAELLYEHWSGKRTYRINDAITNINLGTLDQVSGIFFKVVKIGIYTLIFEQFSVFALDSSIVNFILLFVLYDLCYYWSHRMAHEISLFWGGHVVHHQSEDYNLSVALRQSSTAFIWSVPFYLPLAIIGFDPMQFVFVAGLNLLYQFWIHTEHIKKLPNWFEAVMNTPSHHRVHHARNPEYIDQNYAGVFIVWDKLFGTFTAEKEPATYGITKPLESWNPVYANFAHYIDLFKAVRISHSFSDALQILFRKPGWMPNYLGGYQAPKKLKGKLIKYDAKPRKAKMSIYLVAQFVFLLILTAYFLFNQADFDFWLKLAFSSWIIISTVIIGLLFDYHARLLLVALELVRLLLWTVGIAYLFYKGMGFPALLLIVSGIISILSLFVFIVLQNVDKQLNSIS